MLNQSLTIRYALLPRLTAAEQAQVVKQTRREGLDAIGTSHLLDQFDADRGPGQLIKKETLRV